MTYEAGPLAVRAKQYSAPCPQTERTAGGIVVRTSAAFITWEKAMRYCAIASFAGVLASFLIRPVQAQYQAQYAECHGSLFKMPPGVTASDIKILCATAVVVCGGRYVPRGGKPGYQEAVDACVVSTIKKGLSGASPGTRNR